MKHIISLTLIAVLLLASPPGELFDDFNYKSIHDPLLSSQGWIVVDGVNAPPSGAYYDKSLVSFERDPKQAQETWMVLSAFAGETHGDLRLSRIESSNKFYKGTYAARVFFDHALRKTHDGNIQTFYLITPLNYPNDSLYSECDLEYLPYDIWNADNNKRSAIYASTWESYLPEPYVPDHAMTSQKQNLYGWHTLIMVIMRNDVKYYIDKRDEAFAIHRYSDKGSTVFPESPMHVAFANWISSFSENHKGKRSSTMKIDWFYHAPDTTLGFYEIIRRVNELKKLDVTYKNNLE